MNNIFFQNNSPNPASFVRIVEIRAKPDCGDGVIETKAFLPLYPTPPAGADQVLNFCADDGATDLQTFFDGTLGLGGHAELIMKTFPSLDKYFHQQKSNILLIYKPYHLSHNNQNLMNYLTLMKY